MKKKFTRDFTYFLMILTAICFSILAAGIGNEKFDSRMVGYYTHGFVGIKAWKLSTHEDYINTANHEWGHYLYERYLSISAKNEWASIVDECGFDSTYAQKFRARELRLEEEFSDMVSYYYALDPFNEFPSFDPCAQKIVFIHQHT